MKCLVYGIFFLQFIQSILMIKTGFWIFVTSFGEVGVFDRIDTLWLSVPVLSAISTFCSISACWYSNLPQRYISHPRILCPSDQYFGAFKENRGSNCRCKLSKEFYCTHLTLQKMHYKQLSFIQLGGGIAVGVHGEQKKFYSLLDAPQTVVLVGTSTVVWTIRPSASLSNEITPQTWNIGSVLCDTIIAVCMTYYVGFWFYSYCPWRSDSLLIPSSWRQLSRVDTTVKETKVILKRIIRLTIETGSLTGA